MTKIILQRKMTKIILSVLLVFCSFSSFAQESIVWDTPFESTSEWSVSGDPNNNVWETNQYVGTLVGNAYQGTGALSLAALPTEIRNEFNVDGLFSWGTEYWIGYAFKIVEDCDNLRPFTQIRQAPGSSTNAFTLRSVDGGQVAICTSTNAALADVAPSGSGGDGQELTYFNRVLNQWHVIVMHVNWDYQNGFIKVWIDGDLLVDKTGTTTYRRDANNDVLPGTVYPKIGPYPGNVADKIGEIHYDRYQVWEGAGGSYEDVHPLGLSPNGSSTPIVDASKKKRNSIFGTIN